MMRMIGCQWVVVLSIIFLAACSSGAEDVSRSALRADAGVDIVVLAGETITLDASRSSPSQPLTYVWEQIGGTPLLYQGFAGSVTDVTFSFTAPSVTAKKVWTLKLTVHNGSETATDQIQIIVIPPDFDPPGIIEGRIPAVGAVNVSINTEIVVFFDEDLKQTQALINDSIKLSYTDSANNKIFYNGEIQYLHVENSRQNKLVFIPSKGLEYAKLHQVTLNSSIEDLSGNKLEEVQWSFSTAQIGVPTASNVYITDVTGGAALVGDVLVGNYDYSDAQGDAQGETLLVWLRNGTAIAGLGANSKNYTLVADDAPSIITFRVTPVSSNDPPIGSTVTSNGIIVVAKPLNDTGITLCGDYAFNAAGVENSPLTHNNDLDCTVPPAATKVMDGKDADSDIVPGGQDALYGRDSDVTQNGDADGLAGFSFTKLDSNGVPLANQLQSYTANAWICVKDKVTGLTWEVKTASASPDFRDKTYKYTWYKPDPIPAVPPLPIDNGGDPGLSDGDGGNPLGAGIGTGIGSDNCADVTRCDTEKYVFDVNKGIGLCGATDWRLPNKHELLSIVSNRNGWPNIDTRYFPNTPPSWYWTSSSYAADNAWVIQFGTGGTNAPLKNAPWSVRLVRGGQ